MRERFARECAELATSHSGALWAAERRLAGNTKLARRIRALRREVAREFGWRSRIAAMLVGPVLRLTLGREERRLRAGLTYEPSTFYEANAAALALRDPRWHAAHACRSVSTVVEAPERRPEDAGGLAPDLAPAG